MLRWPAIVAGACAIALPACKVAHAPPLPGGWIAQAAPTDEGAWNCANWSRSEWRVSMPHAESLTITPAGAWREQRSWRMAGGSFELVDRGEFGGHLAWTDSASGVRTELLRANPRAITENAGAVWLWTGLAHLRMKAGAVTELVRQADGRWQLGERLQLPSTPQAVLSVATDTVLVATPDGVLSVQPRQRTSQWLFRNAMWDRMYAQSLARDAHGALYVGMRHAVTRLTPVDSGYREEWLVRSSCTRLAATNGAPPCECRAS